MSKQTVRVRVIECDINHATDLEHNVSETMARLERYGNGIKNVKTETYSTDKKVGMVISYELRER